MPSQHSAARDHVVQGRKGFETDSKGFQTDVRPFNDGLAYEARASTEPVAAQARLPIAAGPNDSGDKTPPEQEERPSDTLDPVPANRGPTRPAKSFSRSPQ